MSELLTLLEIAAPLTAVGASTAIVRAKAPSVYWSAVGLPLTAVRFATTYTSTMDACGLTVQPSRLRALLTVATSNREIRPVPPKVRRMRPTTTGLRVQLRLAPGQEPADMAASCERLRHAWGVHSVHVTEIKPGTVELRLVGFDVLDEVKMPRKISAAGPLRIPVALREDGTAYLRDYRVNPHGLNLGATLSGKSMFVRNLITGLARHPVALVGIDCKRGVEQAPFAPRFSALVTDQAQAAELLPLLVTEMEDRYDLIRNRQGIAASVRDEEITSDIWGLPEKIRPVPVVLVVDEVAELFLVASAKDEKRRDQMVTDLIRLAQLGRAAGIFLEVCGQRFGSELGKGATMLRAQLSGRVVHRVNDVETARMGLGDISPEAMLAATAIPAERPGQAVAGDTTGGWSRIRTPLMTLGEAAEICRATAHLTPLLPALARFRPAVSDRVPPKPTASPLATPHPATS